MTILEKVDQLKGLMDEKDNLKARTTENNKALDICKKELADMMLEEETTKITRSGFSYSLQEKVRYSKKAGCDNDLFDLLRENGLGDLIKETVNAQTLQGAMSNLAEENGGELPEGFGDVINVYEYLDIAKRKG